MWLEVQKLQIAPCRTNITKTSGPDTKDDERVNLSGLPGVLHVGQACPEASFERWRSGFATRPVWGAAGYLASTDHTLAHITGVWISWSGVKWLLRTCLATGQRIYFG